MTVEVFQYGLLFLRKSPAKELSNGKGGCFRVHELEVYTDAQGSDPKRLSVDETFYNLPWEELVRVMPVEANLRLIQSEYERAGKLPRHQ